MYKEYYIKKLPSNAQRLFSKNNSGIMDKRIAEQFLYCTENALTTSKHPYLMYYILALIYRY